MIAAMKAGGISAQIDPASVMIWTYSGGTSPGANPMLTTPDAQFGFVVAEVSREVAPDCASALVHRAATVSTAACSHDTN